MAEVMDHQPPPFFNRGPSPFVRIVLFTLLSLLFMVLDARLHYLHALRQGVSLVVYPLQKLATLPSVVAEGVSDFFVTQSALRNENNTLRQQSQLHAIQTRRNQELQGENEHLRRLLNMHQRTGSSAQAAEILSMGQDPFSRKVMMDKGGMAGIQAGQAVIDDVGVVGQVTRVYPFSSEVTLVTDKNQAVPVQVLRNGLRAVVFGLGQEGTLDLPFMPVSADIVNGDVLVTSGIDGIYPPGLPVATVAKIERNAAYTFAKITCTPSAGVERNRQLLVLSYTPRTPPPPTEEAATPAKKGTE